MSCLLSFASTMKYVGYIVIAILVLLFMVMIHELGHYVAGKILKFKINEFSIGFGPKILQKTKKNGEKFTLRLLPLGGYCAFEGEDEAGNESKEAFNNQKPWKRLIVLFAGAFFNFLSAIIFSFILLISMGYDLVEIKDVQTTSINYEVLQSGDVVYGVDGVKIDFVNDKYFGVLIEDSILKNHPKNDGNLEDQYSYTDNGKTYYMNTRDIKFNIRRNGKHIIVDGYINAIYNEKGEYAGWSLLKDEKGVDKEFSLGTYRYTFLESLAQSVPFSFKWAWKVLKVFGQLIVNPSSLLPSLGGPVTTIKVMADTTGSGYLLLLLPAIAANLAVFNLLPIPALDGCQMIFVIIEWIRKKPINRKVINAINNIGLLVLLGLVVIIDVTHFIFFR